MKRCNYFSFSAIKVKWEEFKLKTLNDLAFHFPITVSCLGFHWGPVPEQVLAAVRLQWSSMVEVKDVCTASSFNSFVLDVRYTYLCDCDEPLRLFVTVTATVCLSLWVGLFLFVCLFVCLLLVIRKATFKQWPQICIHFHIHFSSSCLSAGIYICSYVCTQLDGLVVQLMFFQKLEFFIWRRECARCFKRSYAPLASLLRLLLYRLMNVILYFSLRSLLLKEFAFEHPPWHR